MSTLAIAPDERIKVRVDAVCHTCGVRHKIETDVPGFHRESWDWYAKHDPRTHEVEFLSINRQLPKGLDDRVYSRADVEPWFLTYRENADITIAYANAASITCDPSADSGLNSSDTFTIGRASTAVNNSSNYIDAYITGKTKTTATTMANKTFRVYAYRSLTDSGGTPTYPTILTSDGTLSGTDAEVTLSNAAMLGNLGWLGSITCWSTAAQQYQFVGLQSLATAFGFLPRWFGIYLTQDTQTALSTTAGDHGWQYIAQYFTQS